MGKKFKYKGVTVNAFGLPVFDSHIKSDSARKTHAKNFHFKYFDSVFKKKAPKNLIVMYDIPTEKRKERDWFRRHLQKFDYVMIQKSVWVGPSPLPKDFLDYVKSIGLLGQLRTMKLAKPYSKDKKDM